MWDLRQHLLAGGIESPARERLAAPDLTESFRDHPGDREVPPEATVAEARRLRHAKAPESALCAGERSLTA